MITYQVRIKIEESVEEEWLKWMKTKHVPDVIGTGLVKSFQILKPDSENTLYLFHYHFDSRGDFESYQKDFAPGMKARPAKAFPDQFIAEREVFQWI